MQRSTGLIVAAIAGLGFFAVGCEEKPATPAKTTPPATTPSTTPPATPPETPATTPPETPAATPTPSGGGH